MSTGDLPKTEMLAEVADARILFVTHLPGSAPLDVTGGRFGKDIEVVDFAAVTGELLESFKPHFVVSPFLTQGFDLLDLGTRLTALHFKGAYRVLTEAALPNPGLVLREVRSQCPGLDIDLLSVQALRG